MNVEITVDPHEPLQIVTVGNLRAFIIDPTKYEAFLANFPANGSVVLEKRT